MIPDRLQYFLDYFWDDQTCDQIWTLGARIYHENTSNNTRNMGTSLKNIFITENLKFWNGWKVCVPNVLKCGNLTFWKFKILKSGNDIWNFENLKIWKVESDHLKSWQFDKFKNWKIWKAEAIKLKLGNLKIDKLEIGNVKSVPL